MDRQTTIGLRQALEYLRDGNAPAAKPLLISILKKDRDIEPAWYLLAVAVETKEQKLHALAEVLRLNPGNQKAKEWYQTILESDFEHPTVLSLGPREKDHITVDHQTPAFVEDEVSYEEYRDEDELRYKLLGSTNPDTMFDAWEEPPQPEPTPVEEISKKVPVRSLMYLGGLALLVAVALIIYFSSQNNKPTGGTATAALAAADQPTATQTLAPTQTQEEAVVETPDEPTRTLEPTMTQTATIAPTASLVRANQADVDQIRAEVESVRGLEPFEGLDVFLVARAEKESRPLLYDQFDTPELETAAQDAAQVFNVLGFVSEDYDNLENTFNRRVDYLGGVYVPADYRIYIFGLGFSGIEKYIYSYEYTLASANNQFGISEAGRYPDCLGLDENCMALRALMQGDAALSARLWWSSFASAGDYEPISQYSPPEQILAEDFPPAFVLADLKFPYEAGENFVTYLHNYGGWDLVNAAYANPALTTEQILHPEKYLAGEPAVAVADEPLGSVLGDGWQMLADNTLGEWGTFQILRSGWEFSTQLPEPVSKTASEGWGGDHYQVYVNEAEGTKVLSVHWVWDSQTDAAEFTQTFRDYGNRRFGSQTVEAPTGICWEGEEVYSCMLSVGEETLWLLGPDQGTIDILLGLYPEFTNLVIDD